RKRSADRLRGGRRWPVLRFSRTGGRGAGRAIVRRLIQVLLATGVISVVGVLYAPSRLAFPDRATVGPNTGYSDEPITRALRIDMAKASALLAQSPIWEPEAQRDIYLTQGGWRWRVLALQSGGAFAFRRPFSHAIVVNRCDLDADRVSNGRAIGGMR